MCLITERVPFILGPSVTSTVVSTFLKIFFFFFFTTPNWVKTRWCTRSSNSALTPRCTPFRLLTHFYIKSLSLSLTEFSLVSLVLIQWCSSRQINNSLIVGIRSSYSLDFNARLRKKSVVHCVLVFFLFLNSGNYLHKVQFSALLNRRKNWTVFYFIAYPVSFLRPYEVREAI